MTQKCSVFIAISLASLFFLVSVTSRAARQHHVEVEAIPSGK